MRRRELTTSEALIPCSLAALILPKFFAETFYVLCLGNFFTVPQEMIDAASIRESDRHNGSQKLSS